MSDDVQSRSVQRRVAAQKGEPVPTFSKPGLTPDGETQPTPGPETRIVTYGQSTDASLVFPVRVVGLGAKPYSPMMVAEDLVRQWTRATREEEGPRISVLVVQPSELPSAPALAQRLAEVAWELAARLPACDFVDEGGPCGEPANWAILVDNAATSLRCPRHNGDAEYEELESETEAVELLAAVLGNDGEPG